MCIMYIVGLREYSDTLLARLAAPSHAKEVSIATVSFLIAILIMLTLISLESLTAFHIINVVIIGATAAVVTMWTHTSAESSANSRF